MKPSQRIASVLTALSFGAMLAALGAWIGWRDAPRLPADSEAVGIAHVAYPTRPIKEVSRDDATFGYEQPETLGPGLWLWGSDEYDYGFVRVYVWVGDETTADIAGRLAAQGWQVRTTEENEILARRGALHLEIGRSYHDNGVGYPATVGPLENRVTISRAEPARVPWLSWTGLILGAAAGWWLSLPMRRRVLARAARVLWWTGLALLSLPALMTVMALTLYMFRTATESPEALWTPVMLIGWRNCLMIGLLSLVVGLVAAWLPGWSVSNRVGSP
jgi:hypothetical protein